MKTLLASALLLTAVSGVAAQAETRLGFGVDQREFLDEDVTTYGLTLDGKTPNFSYAGFLGTGDFDDIDDSDFDVFSAKLIWTGFGTDTFRFGPGISHQSFEIDGDSADLTWAGVGFESEVQNWDFSGHLMGETDNFDDDVKISLEADYGLNYDWTLTSDVDYINVEDIDYTEVRAGARYDFSQKAYGEFGASYNDIEDIDGVGIYAGIGMKF